MANLFFLRDDLPKLPASVMSEDFTHNLIQHYAWMHAHDQGPIFQGRLGGLPALFIASHEGCTQILKDPRVLRSRSDATGGISIPMPKTMETMTSNMILSDGDDHKRLRKLVSKAFTPRAIQTIEHRVQTLSHTLLDNIDTSKPFDLIQHYALPIPSTVIAEILGLDDDDISDFQDALRVLSEGFSGLGLFRTILFDFPNVIELVERLIQRKRKTPQDDILSQLIHAEESGESLSHQELVSTCVLLIMAGYETTVHLISNSVLTLLQHPQQLQFLLQQPELISSAVEELLRFCGPVHGTKPNFAREDFTFLNTHIPQGSPIIPLLGAANRDPNVFANPNTFDITRNPRNHLAFGHGPHFCLGAALARMEARVALLNLFQRFPDLSLDPNNPPSLQHIPLWYRHTSLFVQTQPTP